MLVDTFSIASDIYPATFDHGNDCDEFEPPAEKRPKGRKAAPDAPVPCTYCRLRLYCAVTAQSCQRFDHWTTLGTLNLKWAQIPRPPVLTR